MNFANYSESSLHFRAFVEFWYTTFFLTYILSVFLQRPAAVCAFASNNSSESREAAVQTATVPLASEARQHASQTRCSAGDRGPIDLTHFSSLLLLPSSADRRPRLLSASRQHPRKAFPGSGSYGRAAVVAVAAEAAVVAEAAAAAAGESRRRQRLRCCRTISLLGLYSTENQGC